MSKGLSTLILALLVIVLVAVWAIYRDQNTAPSAGDTASENSVSRAVLPTPKPTLDLPGINTPPATPGSEGTSAVGNTVETSGQVFPSGSLPIEQGANNQGGFSPGNIELPEEMKRQLNSPPPELPEDLRAQLNAPPPELPDDLKAQLNSPPPELPEDIKRALETPPRVVSIDEVNTPMDQR